MDSQKVSAYAIAKLMLAAHIRRVKDKPVKDHAHCLMLLQVGVLIRQIPEKYE